MLEKPSARPPGPANRSTMAYSVGIWPPTAEVIFQQIGGGHRKRSNERRCRQNYSLKDDGRNPGKGHQTRTGATACTAPSGIAIPTPRDWASWAARHFATKTSRGNPGAWLLLASA